MENRVGWEGRKGGSNLSKGRMMSHSESDNKPSVSGYFRDDHSLKKRSV